MKRKTRKIRLNIQGLIDNAKCYQMVRKLRWPEGVEYPIATLPKSSKTAIERTLGTCNSGGGQASDFWDDSAWRQVVMRMLDNVRQVTIKPLIEQFIAQGTPVNTDEYDIYSRFANFGFWF